MSRANQGRVAKALVSVVLALALTACAGTVNPGKLFGRGKAKVKKAAPPHCPVISILDDAATLTMFDRPGSTDIQNTLYDAQILKVALKCKVKDGIVRAEFGMSGEITLGPQGQPGRKKLPVFAALTLKDQDVIRKTTRESSVTIKAGARSANFIEVIERYDFRLAAGKKATDYEILVGFSLTPAQVKYNRRYKE